MLWRVFPFAFLLTIGLQMSVEGVWYCPDENMPVCADPHFEDSCCNNSFDFCGMFGDECTCSPEWTLQAEILTLKASAENSDYGKLFTIDRVAPANLVTKARTLDLRGRWKTGYRLALSYQVPCSCWGVDFEWTHLKGLMNDHTSVNQPLNGNERVDLQSNYGILSTTPFADAQISADSDVSHRLTFNAYDLLAHANIECCTWLKITPYAGIRGVRIEDTLRSKYQQNRVYNFFTSPAEDLEVTYQSISNKFYGIGVLNGLKVDVDACCDLYLHGDAKWSYVYGKYHKVTKENASHSSTSQLGLDVKAKSHLNQTRWIAEWALGIGWKKCVCGFPVDILVTWQQILFFEGYNGINAINGNYGFKGFGLQGSVEF